VKVAGSSSSGPSGSSATRITFGEPATGCSKRKYRAVPGFGTPTIGQLVAEELPVLLPPTSQRCTTSNCSPKLAL
jgi:hypothetical protein